MKTATYRYVDRAGRRTGIIRFDEGDSWNHLFGPLGVHAPIECQGVADDGLWWAGSLRITAGVMDSPDGYGGVEFDLLEFDFGEPVCVKTLPGVEGIRAEGTKIILGGDGRRHCIPVGHAIRIRYATGSHPQRAYERIAIDRRTRIAPGVRARHPESMRGDLRPWTALTKFGASYDAVATPLGERYGWLDPGQGGGFAIDFMPGYDGDVELMIRRSDAEMNAVGCDTLSMRDGSVIDWHWHGVDGWWHGWLPEQQPHAFLGGAGAAPESDPRIHFPKWWNVTSPTCPYAAYATGTKTYRDSQANNLEHERRVSGALEAACEVAGDTLASIDRRIHAQTMRATFRDRIQDWSRVAAGPSKGKGHPVLGGRGTSWLCDLLCMEPTTEADGKVLARAIANVTMPNGFRNSKPWPTGGSPDPHEVGPDITRPLRKTSNSCQVMEDVITAFVLARAGELDAARLTLDRLFRTTVTRPRLWYTLWLVRGDPVVDTCIFERAGGIPKFLGVTDSGKVVRRVNEWTDGSDYFPLVAAALGMYLARDPQVFQSALLKMPSPNGLALGSKANALAVFARPDELGREQTSVCAAALEERA